MDDQEALEEARKRSHEAMMAWTAAMRDRADNVEELRKVHQERSAEYRRLKEEQDAIDREERRKSRASAPARPRHVGVVMLFGAGRSRWSRSGGGEVDPGEQRAIFVVPEDKVTDDDLEALEGDLQDSQWSMFSFETLDMPVVVCSGLSEVKELLQEWEDGGE